MRCRYPKPLKVVRFVGNSLSSNELNISRADIAYILENDGEEAGGSMQPVTLYIAVNITPPDLYIDKSNSWERAVGRIKRVMDILGPIAEVRAIPF